jgi:hypothetical protein
MEIKDFDFDFDFKEVAAMIMVEAERKMARRDALNKRSKGWSEEPAGSTGTMSQVFWRPTTARWTREA